MCLLSPRTKDAKNQQDPCAVLSDGCITHARARAHTHTHTHTHIHTHTHTHTHITLSNDREDSVAISGSRARAPAQQPSFESYIPSPILPQLLNPFLSPPPPPPPLLAPSNSAFVRAFTVARAGGISYASAGECERVWGRKERDFDGNMWGDHFSCHHAVVWRSNGSGSG